MIDPRRIYLVPPCDSESDGELSVLGVRQARALGDALGDVALWAAYTAPTTAALETAEAVAGRQGLALRRRPDLGFDPIEPFEDASTRLVKTFETIARAGPGRMTLVVAAAEVVAVLLAHCRGATPEPGVPPELEPASLTEVLVEEDGYRVLRVGDVAHLGSLARSVPRRDD